MLASGQAYPLPGCWREGAVTLGVRPENVFLAPNGIKLQVELVEPLGSETLVHGRMADGTPLLAKLQGAEPVADAVTVALDPAALHIFDRSTGARLERIREPARTTV